MKPALLILLACSFSPLAPEGADKKDPPRKQTKATLEGTWDVAEATYNGKKARETSNRQVVIRGETLTAVVDGERKRSLTLALDPSKKPAHIDLSRVGDPKTALGIYEVKGDTLKLCYGEPGGERPKAFESKEGDKVYLLVLKRAKP